LLLVPGVSFEVNRRSQRRVALSKTARTPRKGAAAAAGAAAPPGTGGTALRRSARTLAGAAAGAAQRVTSLTRQLGMGQAASEARVSLARRGSADGAGKALAALRAEYAAAGQSHVFAFLDAGKLSESESAHLVAQLRKIKPSSVLEIFRASTSGKAPTAAELLVTPVDPREVVSLSQVAAGEQAWSELAFDAVSRGEVAFLILGGGQGTRLGFDKPKGMYNMGLPSGKPLFALQAERLVRLVEIVKARQPEAAETGRVRVPLYVMTSPLNDADTRAFFADNKFFGLPAGDVVFFEQGMLPCISGEGKIILERKDTVAQAPDGNGGIYRSMVNEGVVADMAKRGVKYVHVSSVDNALVQSADPIFVGYCIHKRAPVGNKGCPKVSWDEKVGVMAKKGGKFAVVEYSELDEKSAKSTTADGRLLFSTGNICNHFFTLQFLKDKAVPAIGALYHVAHKKIPCADPATGETVKPAANNGIKLEAFIFDVFSAADDMGIIECDRKEEFAPIKNAPGEKTDSPDTARAMIYALHLRWLTEAGVKVDGAAARSEQTPCEITPRVSMRGEGLAAIAATGAELKLPLLLCKPLDMPAPKDAKDVQTKNQGIKLRSWLNDKGVNVYQIV
jgi:UDP-N-acetylglucosamine/UDP-N-acetylgalactosamine diphosphorylase